MSKNDLKEFIVGQGKKLSREDIELLDMNDKEKKFAFMAMESGADVILMGENENGYELNYLFSPK